VTIVPPEGEESIEGRKERQVWKWERVLMWKQRVIAVAERERRGWPFTIPALFIRMVGGPSWGLGQYSTFINTCFAKYFLGRSER
jgi:hypothetical protein